MQTHTSKTRKARSVQKDREPETVPTSLATTLATLYQEEQEFVQLAKLLSEQFSSTRGRAKVAESITQSKQRLRLIEKLQQQAGKPRTKVQQTPVSQIHTHLKQLMQHSGESDKDILLMVGMHKAVGMLFTDYSYAANISQHAPTPSSRLTTALISSYQELQQLNDELSDLALSILENSAQSSTQNAQVSHEQREIYSRSEGSHTENGIFDTLKKGARRVQHEAKEALRSSD